MWKKSSVVVGVPEYQFAEAIGSNSRNKVLHLKKEELFTFIGINLLMGYHELPSWRNYCSTAEDLHVHPVAFTMTRDRFDTILSNLHVNDNTRTIDNKNDELYKIRPITDSLNNTYPAHHKSIGQLSVDESMMMFKGRSSIEQYNSLKPIKRGYKLWCQIRKEANRDFVVKKIQSLRGSFRKEAKKVEESKRSGASADDVYVPSLWYYDLLLFTKDQEMPTSSISNISYIQESDNLEDQYVEHEVDVSLSEESTPLNLVVNFL
ncbi:Alcohol dehydrogenase transcription factor Myb/SANT-like [Popillia japonica]|uniref:Alcohol dehydrogenase transcription factor Myb/SANT-like n=1 Tax=Popillia japonica TaxID=7064 RepID=A0AAW1K1E1_POPJA